MKRYQTLKQLVDPHSRSAQSAPIFFPLNPEDPPVGTTIARYWDNQGKYLGYTSVDVTRKYLYGQLYYKGARRWSIKGQRNRYGTKLKLIAERLTGKIGLYIKIGHLTEVDLVDHDDNEQKATKALEMFQPITRDMVRYGAYNVPDHFKILEGMKAKLQRDLDKAADDVCARYNQLIPEYLKQLAASEKGMKTLVGDLADLQVADEFVPDDTE